MTPGWDRRFARRGVCLPATFLLAIGAAVAQPARPAPAPSYKNLKYPPLGEIRIPKVDTSTLPNGIRLYLLEDHELPTINGVALVRTGNLFDPPNQVGLAAMTGALMRSGGVRTKTGEELDKELEDIAASVETGIGETSGSVSFSALKENTDQVLAIFKDILTAPEFRQDKIELTREQMRSGISRRNDDAQGIVQREFANLLYGKDTPYGWSEEYATVDRITRAGIQAFYKRYFFPRNVMLAVRGDFDSAGMKSRIQKLFADWTVEQSPVPPFPKVQPVHVSGLYLAVKPDVTQSFFAVGQRGGELNDKDYAALEIMAHILGGGFQSRLVQRIRTRMGNAYDISANWGAGFDHPGLFEIVGSTKSPSTAETLKAIREEVDRIRSTEVSEEELRSAKETTLNSLVFAYDTKSKTLNRILTYEYFGYPADFIQRYQKAVEAVTRADVLRVAKERLDPASFVTVITGNPADFGTPIDTPANPAKKIDLTIPEPKAETPKNDPASIEKAKRILSRAQQAVGGLDKLTAIKDFTLVFHAGIAQPGGVLQLDETDRWLAPGDFRQDSVIQGAAFASYFNGQSGWSAAGPNSAPLNAAQLKDMQGKMLRVYPLPLLSDRLPGRTVAAIDDETVEIDDAAGNSARFVFDPGTGLPVSANYEMTGGAGPPQPMKQTYSDFREAAGIKVPFKVTITENGRPYADVTVKDFQVNTGLKAEDLSKRP